MIRFAFLSRFTDARAPVGIEFGFFTGHTSESLEANSAKRARETHHRTPFCSKTF
jgi:hypothetical protein